MRSALKKFGVTAATAAGTLALLASPSAAAPAESGSVGIAAIPKGCSGWIDYTDRGRGHIDCGSKPVDVRATVKCTNGKTYSDTGWRYARAECPPGYGATALSGKAW